MRASDATIDADAPLILFDEIDSTNEEARRRAARGDVGPALIVARRQTAGRGRRGRSWSSQAPGNVFMTYLSASNRPPAHLALLGFAAGLALAEQCDAMIGAATARLKWPNDVLLDARKAAGILLETGARSDAPGFWLAIGIGCNLAEAPRDAGQPAASVAEFLPSPPPPPERFAQAVLARLATWAARLDAAGFAPLREAWRDRAHGIGEIVRATGSAGELTGRIRGLSPRGELELVSAAGDVQLISAGDIYFPAGPV